MTTETFRQTALRITAATTACMAVSAMAFGQDQGKISVTLFSDFYTVLEHNDPAVNGMNGFWFRRIYLTYDRKLEEGFGARVRLEALSPGDFTTAGTLTTKYKDVYLTHTGERHMAYFGLTPTPAILNYESFHPGYRAVEKTPLDLYKMATTRDTGVGVKSTMGGGGTRYWVMVGNDSGTTAETNKGKAFYLTVSRDLSEKVVGEVNLIYADKAGGDHWTTVAGFLGFTGDGFDASLFYGHQARTISGGPNVELDVLSFFIGGGTGRSRPFLRVDIMGNPVPGGDTIPFLKLATTANPMLFIAGVDMTLSENVHLIPNIEWVTYRSPTGGPTPGNDLFFRLTVSASF